MRKHDPNAQPTALTFPIRVDIATGARLEPTGLDPHALPWVQGAAQTVPGRTVRKYAEQQADLIEKLAVLKAKRPAKLEAERDPHWGPRRRTPGYRSLHGRPLPDSRTDIGRDEREMA